MNGSDIAISLIVTKELNECVPMLVLGLLCIITIRAGCCLRMLYVKGTIMMIAAGGAFNESLDNLLTNDANKVAGKWLDCLSNNKWKL